MTTLLLSLVLSVPDWSVPTPPDTRMEQGYATYYADGLMVTAARNQGIDIPSGSVPVALNRRGDKGRSVWLAWPSGHIDMGVSVDCAAPEDFDKRLEQRRIVEVPAWVARREGFYGLGPAEVEVWYTLWPPVRGPVPN